MGPRDTDSPLEAVGGGAAATTAFKRLGNETRLAILVALWERYEPFGEADTVPFSDLQDRVGTSDSGQFNYHLDQLEGHFVEATDEGYRLSEAGRTFVQSVIAGAGIETPTLERTEVDMDCGICGSPVEIEYRKDWVYIRCTNCPGIWTDEDGSSGHLAKLGLHPAGLADRGPEEIYAAAWVRTFKKIHSMLEGVCPVCTGPVDRSLVVCTDHEPDGRCGNCDRRAAVIGRLCCPVCKESSQSTLGGIATYHPRVVAFCYDHDLPVQFGFNDLSMIEDRLRRVDTDIEVLSTDPPRVRVTTTIDGDETWVELDENLRVVDAA